MSADNGIYIGHFDDGYRVIHAQSIKNIYEGPEYMKQYFGKATVWPTLDYAYNKAKSLLHELELEAREDGYPFPLEYGIRILELGEWSRDNERK